MSDRAAVACSHCGHMYALPKEFLGKKATCKSCGQKFIALATALPRSTPVGTAPPPAVAPPAGVPRPASKPPAAETPPSPRPVPSVVLPSKREVPISPPARTAASGVRSTQPVLGGSLDDSVLSWLDEDDADDTPPPPRVVTAADMCDPTQRQKIRGPNGGVPDTATAASAKH